MQYDAVNTTILLSITALIGLLFCFFGSRYFRSVFALTVFAAAMFIAYGLSGMYFTTLAAKLAVSVTCGLILALVLNLVDFIGKFVTGVLSAFSLAVLVLGFIDLSVYPYFWDAVIFVSLIAGMCAVVKKSLLRTATAFFGSFIVLMSLFFIFSGILAQYNLANFESVQKSAALLLFQYKYFIAGGVAALTVLGIFVQFWLALRGKSEEAWFKKRKKKKKAVETQNSAVITEEEAAGEIKEKPAKKKKKDNNNIEYVSGDHIELGQ